jgi:hypothetical protein
VADAQEWEFFELATYFTPRTLPSPVVPQMGGQASGFGSPACPYNREKTCIARLQEADLCADRLAACWPLRPTPQPRCAKQTSQMNSSTMGHRVRAARNSSKGS